jgi:hypothetical protein
LPPIIISAIERDVSCLGSAVPTTLPPRRIVAVQLVGNVEDRAAARSETAQSLEQLLDLLRGQHGGRFVHDQEPRIEQEGAYDLDALPFADAERGDDPARVEFELIGVEHAVELGEQFALRQARVETERDIFQHGQRLEQREMLEHHPNAEPPRRARIGDASRRPVEQDLALVGSENAVNHLDERGFAGAVLAEQGVDLARLDLEMHIVVGAHAGKRLADANKLQTRGSLNLQFDKPLASRRETRPNRRVRRKIGADGDRPSGVRRTLCHRCSCRAAHSTLSLRGPVSNELADGQQGRRGGRLLLRKEAE